MEVRLSTKKREDIPDIKVIYLTSQAYAQLLNVLFQVITDSRVNKESLCLKKLKENGLKISNKININVNSPYNLVYNGNIDGEGHLLSDRVLCNNGDIKKYISSYSTGGIDNEDSIISGFRFDYRQNPIPKVYGIYVSPGKHSISEIITKYNSVAKIDFFQGLEEGLNQSLNFAAIVNIEFLEGGKYIGSSRREISSNVIHLLENVVEVSSNMSYELDGSIKLPDVIIESSL